MQRLQEKQQNQHGQLGGTPAWRLHERRGKGCSCPSAGKGSSQEQPAALLLSDYSGRTKRALATALSPAFLWFLGTKERRMKLCLGLCLYGHSEPGGLSPR